ncbi:hypothetical protein T439DRAFT_329169 [Meredithblackwellia eburnea MCA 4105]
MIRWSGGEGVWIDRYDALNLLQSLPGAPGASHPPPTSPTALSDTGFSDLPSDSEEMFYFDVQERDEIARKKKRRKLEAGREDRLKALRDLEDAEHAENEPSGAQLALMHKLHATLSSSPNPSILEIRILANHGSDPRFQFLRNGGQWRDVWERIRAGQKGVDSPGVTDETKDDKLADRARSSLVAYGSDSDSEVEEEGDKEEKKGTKDDEANPIISDLPAASVVVDDVARKKLERAKEWAAKRKAARETSGKT